MEILYLSKSCLQMAGGGMHLPHAPLDPSLPALITMSLTTTTPTSRFGFWPCNKVLKLNFQSIILQTNNDCSLLSLILAKLLLLDINRKNIFALSRPIVTALTAQLHALFSFFNKKVC